MPHSGIASEKDELLEVGVGAGGFKDPEEPFDGDVHDVIGRFLAGG